MTAADKIYLYIQEGDHFYDPLNCRNITVYSYYKDSKTALCTVEEYSDDDELEERYNQVFTFQELAHFEKEDRYNDGSNY